jgi:nicotinamide mononucleotide (NMN) deamidase PncC
LKSSFGTAAGLVFEHDDFVIVALPGPPRELQPMVREGLIPYLTKRFVYAEDETTLEQCVAKLLEARGTTLALGEVGSAGAVAAGLDAVNGAERILMGAFVAPTEERMRQLLRVPDDAWPQNAPSDQRAKLLADVAAERTGGGWVVVVGQPQSGDSGTNFVEVAFRPPNGNADTQRFSLRGTGEMSRASLTTQILDQLRRRLR